MGMKKVFLILMAALLLCVPALAHPLVTVYVDGTQVSFDQPPVIQNDRTLVPMRKIFEAMGAEVAWEESTQTVTAAHGSDVIVLHIGETALYRNGAVVYTMPVPAQILNDRTLVPLRAVAESLGASVAWDGTSYVVTIQSKSSGTEQQTPMDGGYTTSVCAANGTEVLHIELKCDTVSAAEVNAAIAMETYAQGKAFLEQYREQALQAYTASPETFRTYYFMGAYSATRQTNGYVSFLATTTAYAGKTEQTEYFSHTYASDSGKECALSDLVSDTKANLQALWRASFTALIQADEGAFYSDAESRLEKQLDAVQFYLTESGIVFYLPAGVLAPEEMGTVSFEIAYTF